MVEKRLIDACALTKAIRTDYFEHFTQYHDTDQIALIDMVCDEIKESTTVDAVEVVRCKDCIRRYDTDECPMCHLSEGKYYEYTNGNGYCDRGERKENELVEREI